jgi:hypothetical protein
MSVYFSRFNLNTYSGTPYFQAHCPADYPLSRVLQKCRAFRRLPPNLRGLSALAKKWAAKHYPYVVEEVGHWYDAAGNELDPGAGEPLTDEQIDAQWQPDPGLDELEVADIPVPEGGFPDPETWRPKHEVDADTEDADDESDRPTEAQILGDIAGHGRALAARTYGIPDEQLAGIKTDRELAQAILTRRR